MATHIDCGGPSYLDMLGITWSADNYSTGGVSAQSTATIAGTNDQLLYQYQETDTSSGSGFTYTINVPSGSYFLRLLFAETVNTGAGQRVFDVTANGATILSNFDIFAAAGNANTAVDRILPITVGSSGLTLTFKGTTGLATVSGIALAQMPAGGGVITGESWSYANGTLSTPIGAPYIAQVLANGNLTMTFKDRSVYTFTLCPTTISAVCA